MTHIHPSSNPMLTFIRATLLPAILLSGCATVAHPPRARTVDDHLRALEARVASAIDAGDTATLELLVAPGFALVAQDTSRRVEREAWIANTRRFTFDSVRAEVTSASARGDTADVALRLHFIVTGPERPRAREIYDLADRWVRSDGAWKLARRRLLARQTR